MKKSKLDELERLRYFGRMVEKQLAKVTPEDIDAYFAFSERGIRPDNPTEGYWALNEAKRWQGIHAHELYEPDVIHMEEEGLGRWIAYNGFIEKEVPRTVIDFLKKEMFKGKDADLIESVYQHVQTL